MDHSSGSDSFATNPNLGAHKMEKEQQMVELRMDWSISFLHRYLGLTAILYRS